MKGTWLFGGVVACLAAFTIYDYTTGHQKEEAKSDASRVIQLPRADISDLQIEGQSNAFHLVKTQDHWSIVAPIQESADQQQVFAYLDQLIAEKSQSTVNENPTDLAQYGLVTPLFTLTVKTSAASERVKLGTVKAYDGSLYAQIDDQKKVVLVSSAWDVILSKRAKDLRDTKLYQRAVKVDFDRIKVKGRESNFEILRKDGVYVLPGSVDPIFQESVKAWLEQVKALRGVAFTEQPVLNFKPEYTITLERKGDKPFEMRVARDTRPEQYIVTSTDLPGGFHSFVITGQSAMDSILVRTDVFYDKRAPFNFPINEVAHLRFHDARSGKDLDTSVDPRNPDALVKQLFTLEAVRFRGLARGQSDFKSKVTLLKSDGSVAFEMSWGDPIVEPATLTRPEARFLPVVTSLSKQVVGVPEKLILNLARQPDGPAQNGSTPPAAPAPNVNEGTR